MDNELHLHLRDKHDDISSIIEPSNLVDRVIRSVAFAFGFHPWPVYRELRIDHRITERWISPRLGLKHSFLAPISKSLWAHYIRERSNPLYSILPTIAYGLSCLEENEQDRLETLLWHVRSSDLSELPRSTKTLILCAAFDGLMQLIAGLANKPKRPPTDTVWRKASESLGLSWDRWTNEIFNLRQKYRNDLSHGRLWVPEEKNSNDDIMDYARLGRGFMTVFAARCGYEGPILADPFEPRQAIIQKLKEELTSNK